MQLSVIIVNYNVKYFLEHCLMSVLASVKNLQAEILVVDNNSTDGSREYFRNRFPEVQFFWNPQNAGFAKANNFALEKAVGRYILFLNPDTLLPEDCFIKCINFLQHKNDDAALGIRMVDGTGKFLKESKRAFPAPMTSLFKLSGLSALFPKSPLFSRYHLGHLPPDKTCEVDVLAGAFMLIPKKIIDAIGGFDEDYFMYGEDIDLSYRIQKSGFSNFYFADSTIIHFKGESTKKSSLNYVRVFYKAMSIFAKKHYGGSKAGLYHHLIQAAIYFRGALSGVTTMGGKLIHPLKKRRTSGKKHIGVMGKTLDAQAAIQFQKEHSKEAFKEVTFSVLGEDFGRAEGVDKIIFCEDSFSFKEIIEWVQQMQSGSAGFYSRRCNSYIG